jgi:hypothetical protein
MRSQGSSSGIDGGPVGRVDVAMLHLNRSTLGLVGLLITLVCSLAFAPLSSAANFQRPFVEVFGSAEQPSFAWPRLVAVDPATDDVLVGDFTELVNSVETGGIRRFHANGSPAPFAALGSDVIDGKRGPGGQPCAVEPESCDETPQGSLTMSFGSGEQIAVDPVNGDILVTQGGPFATRGSQLVYIFSSEGKYLGQIDSSAAASGPMEEPCGVAVDASGAIYVAAKFSRVAGIAKYVPSGNPPVGGDGTAFFPIDVPGLARFCHLAIGTGASAGSLFVTGTSRSGVVKMDAETGEVGMFAEPFAEQVTVDPSTGNPIVVSQEDTSEAVEFDGSGPTAGGVLSRLILNGKGSNNFEGLAANTSGEVYVITGAADPQVFVYGHPAVVPAVTSEPASGVIGTKATLVGTVDPEGLPVEGCVFEYGTTTSYGSTIPCEGSIPPDSEAHQVDAHLSGLAPNGQRYYYRLAATNENGTEHSAAQSFTTLYKVVTDSGQASGATSATLKATLRPEGVPFTACYFEYGVTSRAGYERSIPCDPGAGEIGPDFAPHTVTAALSGLHPGTRYRFRVVATNAGTGAEEGRELTLETFGRPRITEPGARDATQGSATIEAKVNPRGTPTTYSFEWGPTSSYGHRVPAAAVGEGQQPERVKADLSGLSPGSTYHFRVLASSSAGTVASSDQTVETLNSCGLPEARCYELVSPPDVGPVATPGIVPAAKEMKYQASDAPGAVAYVASPGLPGATKASEALYRGTRGSAGWGSVQLSPPVTARNLRTAGANSSRIWSLSGSLSCGAVESFQPLTDDPAMRLAYENGGANLYRLDPDGSYTPITTLAPENPNLKKSVYFSIIGMSQDCLKIDFFTEYRYPGLAGAGTRARFYEWDEGVLRALGLVPGPGGREVPVAAASTGAEGSLNRVSVDGSRVFFAAERQTSPNVEEIGRPAVFAREGGNSTRDISLSETPTPDIQASYQWATADGSRAFFIASAGIARNGGSSEGNDLYEYDYRRPEGERLTDLSIDHDAGGAEVSAFLGASDDGSHIYFLARGQLLPGRGNTRAENEADDDYSVYGVSGGKVSFVGTVGTSLATAQASADGRYLLFESNADVTGYQSDGASEAYLYDADTGREGSVTCLSCRPDGHPSIADASYEPLAEGSSAQNALHPPRILSGPAGEPRAVFSSPDALVPGAVEGEGNLYEWAHGQVFLLTSEPAGSNVEPGKTHIEVQFVGASNDATDLYFTTPQTLSWEDGDARNSVYDARVGGGFPEPAAPPAPCDPDSEGTCQGPARLVGATPGAASANFVGPGNAKGKKAKKHHRRHRRHHHKGRKGGHGRHGQPRHGKGAKANQRGQRGKPVQANGKRRAGK